MPKKEIVRDAYCTKGKMCSYHAAGGDHPECGHLTPDEWNEAQDEPGTEEAT